MELRFHDDWADSWRTLILALPAASVGFRIYANHPSRSISIAARRPLTTDRQYLLVPDVRVVF